MSPPMSATMPLLVLDEIMLPAAATEVGLDPAELRFLAAALDGGCGPVAVATRPPGGSAPTSMEQRAAGHPGELVPAVLAGVGTLIEPSDDDPTPRLALDDLSRARLGDVTADGDGWRASVEPWPIDTSRLDTDEVDELRRRFFRALLATREADGAPEQLERPVLELVDARDAMQVLFLLADYLYERPDVRLQVLVAEGSDDVSGPVADALELIEAGAPAGDRALRNAIGAWVGQVSETRLPELARIGTVLSTLLEVSGGQAQHVEEARAIAADLEALEARLDKLVGRALKPSGGRR